MSKQTTLANVKAINFGQLSALKGEDGKPVYNPGRLDAQSWGRPETQIPPEMVDGFDVGKGCLVAITVAKAKQIFSELAEIAKAKGQTENAKLYAEIAKNPATYAAKQRKAEAKRIRDNGEAKYRYPVSNPNKPEEDVNHDLTPAAVADTLESFDGVNVEYIVVGGQRRTTAGPFTLALAMQLDKIKQPADYQWLVHVVDPANVAELHEIMLDENNQNARQAYSMIGKLQNAIALLDDRPLLGETDLGRLIGLADVINPENGKPEKSNRGHRQTVYRIAKLAMQLGVTDCQIGERVAMPADVYKTGEKEGQLKYVKGGHIPLNKLNKEDIACLLGQRKEATNVIKAIFPEYEKGWKATLADFEKYVKAIIAGGTRRTALKLSELEKYCETKRIAESTPKLADVVKAIAEGDKSFFDGLGK